MQFFKKHFSREELAIIGSYSSFFGFLLIATILAYRHIFDYILNLMEQKLPVFLIDISFIGMIIIFAVLFLVIPSSIIIRDIRAEFHSKNSKLAWVLIFLISIYDFALISQFIYTYLSV